MKELLHIPTGTLVRFGIIRSHIDKLSIGDIATQIDKSEYEILLAVACGDMSSTFYKLNGIPRISLESEYEIIEVA